MMRRPFMIYFCLLLMAIGFLLSSFATPYPYGRRAVQIPLSGEQSLKGWLWVPLDEGEKRHPGVVLVHGVAAQKESMDVAARFLARQGLVVLTFDLPGAAESRSIHADLPAAVWAAQAFLRQQPWVRADQVALVGHSLGAQAVLAVAADSPKLALFGALGYHPPPGQMPPCQAFYGVGRYDLLHPPVRLQKPPVVAPCKHVFWSSPAADHTTVTGDILTLQALWRWLQQGWGQPLTAPDLRENYARWGSSFYLSGFWGAALLGLSTLALWPRWLFLGAVAGGCWFLAELHFLSAWDASSILLGLWCLVLLQPWVAYLPQLGLLGLTAVGLWLTAEVAQAGCSDVGALPLLGAQFLAQGSQLGLYTLRAWLFDGYSEQLRLSWFWAILAVEYWRPGFVLGPVIVCVQRWGNSHPPAPAKKQLTIAFWIGSGVLLGLGVWRWQQGYFYTRALGEMGRVGLVVLAAAIGTIGVGYGIAYLKRKRAVLKNDPL